MECYDYILILGVKKEKREALRMIPGFCHQLLVKQKFTEVGEVERNAGFISKVVEYILMKV